MRKSILASIVAAAVLIATAATVFMTVVGSAAPPIRVARETGARLQVRDLRPAESGGAALEKAKPPRSSGAAVNRVRVPAAGISGAITVGSVDANNVMIPPGGPTTIAWYQYSARPGQGGNAVFSGHVDYHDYGPAVFWTLRNARIGDMVEVDLADGSTLRYQIEFNRVYSANNGPWDDLFDAHAGEDVITMYTCDGVFSAGAYSDRRVVRASRIS